MIMKRGVRKYLADRSPLQCSCRTQSPRTDSRVGLEGCEGATGSTVCPALEGGTPFPRGPHSVGRSPGWGVIQRPGGWPSPECLPQCPPCFPPGPVPSIRWVGCGQAPMTKFSRPSAGAHRHTCVVCMGQPDLVLARFPTGTRLLGGGPQLRRKV